MSNTLSLGMKQLPISVIITSYQRPKLTSEALRSVCEQSYWPQEIFLIDDFSDHEAANGTKYQYSYYQELKELCSNLCEEFPQLRKILQISCLPRHLGMPGAVRNAAMLRSQCDWLAFLDSDDRWLPNKLESQWQHLVQLNQQQLCFPVIHCRELWLRFQADQSIKTVSQKRHKHLRCGTPAQMWPHALKKCILGPSTLMIHRSVLPISGYFDPQIEIAEDYEYFLRIIAHFPVAYIDKPLVEKRDCYPAPAPQLSHLYPWIEPFRIKALERLLTRSNSMELLGHSFYQHAVAELLRKYHICALGAAKRRAISETHKLEKRLNYWKQIKTTL